MNSDKVKFKTINGEALQQICPNCANEVTEAYWKNITLYLEQDIDLDTALQNIDES